MLGKIKPLIERLTGSHIYRYKVPPRGLDPMRDLQYFLPNFRAEVVFDVGANVGQFVNQYFASFPGCRVYCFEPGPETFEKLSANFKGRERLECHHMAMGAAPGRGRIVCKGDSDLFQVIGPDAPPPEPGVRVEEVEIGTVDAFRAARGIEQINYLKIDTEGGDLEVLRGAAETLRAGLVDLIEVEAGMNSRNKLHVPIEQLKAHMESHNCYLFGVYEQKEEWIEKEPQLRRSNLVFISEKMINENRMAGRNGA